jgi:hypothetical protein
MADGSPNTIFFCQTNGWGPKGDWGAPTAQVEAAFDRMWQKPICRGQQAIQPRDYDWPKLFEKLYANRATYCEIYAPLLIRLKESIATPRRRRNEVGGLHNEDTLDAFSACCSWRIAAH